MAPAPDHPIQKRISELTEEIAKSQPIRAKIPYPSVRDSLKSTETNARVSLKFLDSLLRDVLMWRSEKILEYESRFEKDITLEDVMREWYTDYLSTIYHECDRVSEEYTESQLNSTLPPEIYLWISDLVKRFTFQGSRKTEIPPMVFQQSSQYINSKYSDSAKKTVEVLLELSGEDVKFGVEAVKGRQIAFPYDQFANLYVISYIPGGSRNPILWPVLAHEAIHVVDKEWGLLGELETRLKGGSGAPHLPLDDNPDNTNAWTKEIAIDLISLSTAGPMFSDALATYFDYLPYVANAEYPGMNVRLYVLRKFLVDSRNELTGHFDECRSRFLEKLNQKNLKEPKYHENLDKLYGSVYAWMVSSRLTQFSDVLETYGEEAESYKGMQAVFKPGALTDEDLDVKPFVNPFYSYDEILRLVFVDKVPLAIHPSILLNVCLSQWEDHVRNYKESEIVRSVLVKSIHRWKVTKEWARILGDIPATDGGSSQ